MLTFDFFWQREFHGEQKLDNTCSSPASEQSLGMISPLQQTPVLPTSSLWNYLQFPVAMGHLCKWDWLTNSCRSLSPFFSSSTPSQHLCPRWHLKEAGHKQTSWSNSCQARRTKLQIWEDGIICLAAACSVEVAKSKTVKFPLNLHFLWCNSLKWSRVKKFQNCRPAADKMPCKLCHLWLGLSQSTNTQRTGRFC